MELIKRNLKEEDVNLMSPLTWAYIGDCVYELYIRNELVNKTRVKPHKLHLLSIQYVKAQRQAEILHKIYDKLTDEEKYIVKRGRNAENHHLPKNCSVEDYAYSTAFESLIGYLYLCKKDERLQEILSLIDVKIPLD